MEANSLSPSIYTYIYSGPPISAEKESYLGFINGKKLSCSDILHVLVAVSPISPIL